MTLTSTYRFGLIQRFVFCHAFFIAVQGMLLAAPSVSQSPSDGAKPCGFDSSPHPRVLVTGPQLEFLRADTATNTTRRAIYEKDVKANADRWLHRSIVIPEQGGAGHDFCGPDGVLLELPVDQQFDSNEPSRSPTTGKNYDSEKIRAARRFFEHYWLTFAVRDLALASIMEQRRDYADKAAEILLKYADAYPHFVEETNGFGFQPASLTESVCLIPMAQGYDLLYNSGALSDEQKRHIEQDFFWPEAQRISQRGLGGNWGSWHLSAVGVIGYATGHQRFADYGLNSFKSQITEQLGYDGLWPESIHCYHFYALDAFLSFAEAAANNGQDLFHWEPKPGKGIQAMFHSALYYIYPTMQMPAIDDGWYDAWLPEDQYAVAWHHFHKPEFAWAIHRSEEAGHSGVTGDFYDQRYRLFLFGEKLPDTISAPVFTSTNFPVLGISILRQSPQLPAGREMFLTFHYGPFLGHGQHDKMGITLFAHGEPVAPGLGTTCYGSPVLNLFTGVAGHNTIAVDGKNQPRTTDNQLLAFHDEPSFKLAAAETRQVVPGTSWIRAVLVGNNYAVIWDDLRGDRKHQFDWLLHAFGDQLTLDDVSDTATNTSENKLPYQFITGVHVQKMTGTSAGANWVSADKTGLRVWLMGDTNNMLFSARCPSTDGKSMPMIVLRKNARDCQFLTVLEPWKGAPSPLQIHADLSGSNMSQLTITEGPVKNSISFNRDAVSFDSSGGDFSPSHTTVPLSPRPN